MSSLKSLRSLRGLHLQLELLHYSQSYDHIVSDVLQCDKFLKELAESGEIEVNDKGKTAVYWAKQNAADSASPEELAELDVRIKELRDVIPALKLDAKNKAAELNSILSAATTEELSQDVEKLQTQKAEMEGRLKVLRSGTIKPINKQERAKTEVEYKKWESLRNRRKRCFAEVEASLIEQGLRKDELWVGLLQAPGTIFMHRLLTIIRQEQCDIDDDPII